MFWSYFISAPIDSNPQLKKNTISHIRINFDSCVKGYTRNGYERRMWTAIKWKIHDFNVKYWQRVCIAGYWFLKIEKFPQISQFTKGLKNIFQSMNIENFINRPKTFSTEISHSTHEIYPSSTKQIHPIEYESITI